MPLPTTATRTQWVANAPLDGTGSSYLSWATTASPPAGGGIVGDPNHGLAGGGEAAVRLNAGNALGQNVKFWQTVAVPTSGGQSWEFSVYGYGITSTAQLVLSLSATPGGAALAGCTQTFSLTLGAWTRAAATFTLPAGTTNVYPVVAINAVTVNDSLSICAPLLEQGTTLGTYFSGNFAHAGWTGTFEASSQQMLLLGTPLPNWPAVDLLAMLGVNPPAAGFFSGDGVSVLTDRVRKVAISRGRPYELVADQAGTLDVDLDNRDGFLTGGSNGAMPKRACRVKAIYQGVAYDLFTGHADRWPTAKTSPTFGVTQMSATDLFDALSQREIQSPMTEMTLTQSPLFYWPLQDGGAGGRATNVTAQACSASSAVFNGGGVNPATGSTNGGLGRGAILAGDAAAFTESNSGSTAALDTLLWHLGVVAGPYLDLTQPWQVQFVFTCSAATTASDQVPVLAFFDVNDQPCVQLTIHNGNMIAQLWPGAAASAADPSNSTSQPVGSGTQSCSVGWNGTNLYLHINGTSSSVASAAPSRKPDRFVLGYSWGTNAQLWTMNQYAMTKADLQVAHLAWWQSWTDARAQTFKNSAAIGLNQTTGTRLSQVLSWLGITDYSLDSTANTMGRYAITASTKMSDAMRTVAQDDLGRIFVDATGSLVFHNRNHGQTQLNVDYTFGSAAGELPYTGSPTFGFDATYIYNDVTVSQPGGSATRVVDTASEASYFQRTLQRSMNYSNPVDIQSAAYWLLHGYSQPLRRADKIVLDPSANPALWPCVLNIELNQLIQLNQRPLGGGAPTLALRCLVQSIKHTIEPDKGTWLTELALAPTAMFWILAPLRTTMAAAAAVGATTITLAPLPDSAYNAAEASLTAGQQLTLSWGLAWAENVTVATVTSAPTPRVTGYTSITVTLTAATTNSHPSGDPVSTPIVAGALNQWDSRSVLGTSTTITY